MNAGGDWYEAQHACPYLSEDGLILTSTLQDIWRLPTVDEAVRSMALHGQNSGGGWDEERVYIIVYDGEVWPRSKRFGPAYLGFRCVRQP